MLKDRVDFIWTRVRSFSKRWLHSRQQKDTTAAGDLPGVSIIKVGRRLSVKS